MRFAMTILLFGVFTFSGAAQISTPEERESKIPHPSDIYWTDARELVVMLDSTTDRVLLARAIRDAARDNPGLSISQRKDGLEISGHALYAENALQDARIAFQALVALVGVEPAARASGLRMVAQIQAAEGDLAAAHVNYTEAYTLERDWHVAGVPSSLAIIVPMHAHVAARIGQVDTALQVLADAVNLFESDPGLAQLLVPQYLHQSADIAENAGRTGEAEILLHRLLSDYPSYGMDEVVKSTRASLRLRLAALEGSDLSTCGQSATQVGWEIIRDPAYKSMPLRFSIGETIARCLEVHGGADAASHLRAMLKQDLDELTPQITDTTHLALLARAGARIDIDEARLKLRQGQMAEATGLLNGVIDAVAQSHPDLTAKAQALLDSASP